VHLQTLLRDAIRQFRAVHRPVHIVDVAAGPGRYFLELLKELGEDGLQVTLRDWDEAGLTQGRALARAMGLHSVCYERGDAFDPHALQHISPRPQIIVVSGLYELFPDNALIRRSLGGISALLEPGGQLIYTNQPMHPQLEFIARCLPNREGKPWVMRLRLQREMDQLATEAGFAHRKTLADRWGIFTVSTATKSGPE
jgi:SAM-dependent methyltransferase